MTKYEDVKDISTEEYFHYNYFSIDAFNKKYALFEGETYVQALKRVCDGIASVEDTEEARQYWSERWFDEIYNDWWHPAGSIMQGVGSGKGISLANCTSISLGSLLDNEDWDNLESIIRNAGYSVAKCAAYRQGLGLDFSRLRPRDTKVNNSARIGEGAVHWMKFIDSIGYFVGQYGRTPAFLFSLSCSHPDVIEFIKSKSDYHSIQNANISVQCTDDFYRAVLEDKDWELKFEIPEFKAGQPVYVDVHSSDMDSCRVNNKYYNLAKRDRNREVITKTIKARELLELIAKYMATTAEPGIQNIDVARKYSNSDYLYEESAEYDSRIISTNACSEQYLSRDSLCVLSSINMGKFSIIPEKYEEELKKIAYSINRFLDNVNEYELRNKLYATPFQRLAIENLRRTGAGYTNIADWLLLQNLEYGSAEANNKVAKFTERYNYYLYKSSIELGKEKGNFKLFNREKLERSPFIQHMMELGLEFTHLRNVTVSSIAPTGTLSLMFRNLVLSYGIEPPFNLYYWKRTRISGRYEYYFCVPHSVRLLFESLGKPLPMKSDTIRDNWAGYYGKRIADLIDEYTKELNIRFKSDTDVNAFDKLDLMSRVMKNVDSSISTTYMLSPDANHKDVYNFILEAWKREVKSIAAFPDKKMYGIVSKIPFKDLAFKLISEGVHIHPQNFTEDELTQLKKIHYNLDNIPKSNAPKRPKELPCDVYISKAKNREYFILVGKLGADPYEIVVGDNIKIVPDKEHIERTVPRSVKSGVLRKVKRGHYQLVLGEDILCDNVLSCIPPEDEALTRMVSTALRHGADVNFIVHQLEKTRGGLENLANVMARALKKYIPDGANVTGAACPSCQNQTLVRNDGCVSCSNCGWSRCV